MEALYFSHPRCAPEANIKNCSAPDLDTKSFMTSRILILLSAVLLAGCQSVKELSGLGPEAKTRIGQLRYVTRSRSIIGDIVLRNLTEGDYDLSFSKGGVPVLEFQTRGSRITATGLLLGGPVSWPMPRGS